MTHPKTPNSSLPRPSLAVLRERVHALEVGPEDVYALLEAMARPVAPDEDVPARAQALHRIIDDPVLGGLRDRDGRRVDETAVRALLALGEPYASELSEQGQLVLERVLTPPRPDPLEDEADEDDTPPAPQAQPAWSTGVGGLAILWGFVEYSLLLSSNPSRSFIQAIPMAVALTVIVPGVLFCRRSAMDTSSRVLCWLLLLLSLLPLGACGFLSLFIGGNGRGEAQSIMFAAAGGVACRLILMGALSSLSVARKPATTTAASSNPAGRRP